MGRRKKNEKKIKKKKKEKIMEMNIWISICFRTKKKQNEFNKKKCKQRENQIDSKTIK